MSKAGAKHKAEKRAEVQDLIAQAAEKAANRLADAPPEVIEEQLERIQREQRTQAAFGRCRQKVINEPALWFRAPEHEGAMIGEVYMREAYREMMERAAAMQDSGQLVVIGG